MIIAISGKRGGGKDLVGSMLKYILTRKDLGKVTFGDYLIRSNSETNNYNFEIKKFAEPLKKIVSILFPLKNAEELELRHVKDMCIPIEFRSFIDPDTGKIVSNSQCKNGELLKNPNYSTYREVLIKIGGALTQLNPDIFVNALMKDYKVGSNWIITDLRFKHEYNWLHKNIENVFTIRVNNTTMEIIDKFSKHKSETDLDSEHFDAVINNSNNNAENLFYNVLDIAMEIKTKYTL